MFIFEMLKFSGGFYLTFRSSKMSNFLKFPVLKERKTTLNCKETDIFILFSPMYRMCQNISDSCQILCFLFSDSIIIATAMHLTTIKSVMLCSSLL